MYTSWLGQVTPIINRELQRQPEHNGGNLLQSHHQTALQADYFDRIVCCCSLWLSNLYIFSKKFVVY